VNGKVAVVLGAGPGLGTALAVLADATDPTSVARALDEVREGLGDPEIFIYNAGAFQIEGILELTPEQFDDCFRVNCSGAFYGTQQVLPATAGEGTWHHHPHGSDGRPERLGPLRGARDGQVRP
jgi:NAD(P)-dependent dehydrogenase (short-subunit alcohol dehydrogenase family)